MTEDRSSLPLGALERAAATLRPIEQKVLVLSAAFGLSIGEIAARLGITDEAAERILARALCSFDRTLGQQERPWWRRW